MNGTGYRGLAGRARKTHRRNRANKEFTQLLIDDYFEPGSVDRFRDRFIPIRGRNDFLPAVHAASVEQAARTDTELGMPGARDAAIRYRPGDLEVVRSRPGLSPQPQKCVKADDVTGKRAFSLHGFVVGCALGGSVAAMVLLLLWTLF